MIPENIEKIERNQVLTYLDTSPTGSTRNWEILGIGITEYGIAYNPQVDTEKWIIEKNARTDHSSNQKQGSVSQTAYKNDPIFEFVNQGRDKLNYKTNILDIDMWNGTNGTYPATMSEGKIVVTNYMGENATIEYDLYYEGDITEGTVTISDGVPTFTPTVSL
jgi:hypothetical protein